MKYNFLLLLSAVLLMFLASCNTECKYEKSNAWMLKPTAAQHKVDVFYILPTCIKKGTEDVAEFGETDMQTATFIYSQQAKLFEDFCNIYVPYYRQVPLNVALENCSSAEDMATFVRTHAGADDIFDALNYYFENFNNGRPFILASHSQGTSMMRVVMDTYMKEHPDYYNRLVACYAIGFSLPMSWFDANPHLKYATDSLSTGVIIGWNTEGPGASMPSLLVGSNDYVINPLNWDCTDEYIPASMNLGSLVGDSVLAQLADAQIDMNRHTLICTTDTTFIAAPFFGDKSLHGHDWGLYWGNIKQNAKARIAQYYKDKESNY